MATDFEGYTHQQLKAMIASLDPETAKTRAAQLKKASDDIIKQKPDVVLQRFRAFQVGDIGISAITLAELQYGAAKSARPRQNRESLKEFVSALDVASFDIAATEAYGEIRASLEKSDPPIGAMDLLIVAHALSLRARLATNNEREFKRVRGLRVENWIQ